jgi:hypothetical protein
MRRALFEPAGMKSPVSMAPAALLLRAAQERGVLSLRFSLDQSGAIDRLVWWHL